MDKWKAMRQSCQSVLGTRTKNMNDKLRDGTMLRGETHGQHKLTEQQVLEIRNGGTLAAC